MENKSKVVVVCNSSNIWSEEGKEEKACFGSWFARDSPSLLGGEEKRVRHTETTGRKRNGMAGDSHLTFLILSFLLFQLATSPTFRVGFPSSHKPVWKCSHRHILIGRHWVCFLGDPKIQSNRQEQLPIKFSSTVHGLSGTKYVPSNVTHECTKTCA